MRTRCTWAGMIAAVLVALTACFVGCKQEELNETVKYHGLVVYANTTTPYPNLPVKVTDGHNIHCQTLTDAGGNFDLSVRVKEINGDYYLLAGDTSCVPTRVELNGFAHPEVDLGIIEVEEKKEDKESVKYYIKHPWGGGNWIWREMEYSGNQKYSYSGNWGGEGANINTFPSDDGALWFPETDILNDGSTIDIGQYQPFVYNAKNNTLAIGHVFLNP